MVLSKSNAPSPGDDRPARDILTGSFNGRPGDSGVPLDPVAAGALAAARAIDRADPDPMLGATHNGYELVQRIHRGGQGDLYLAKKAGDVHDPFVVKVVPDTPLQAEQLDHEFQNTRLLHGKSHDHFVRVIETIRYPDPPTRWLVMERLIGCTVAEELAARGRGGGGPEPLDWPDAFEIAADVLDALDIVHATGLIHRDVKPANTFLARINRPKLAVKLIDLGLAISFQVRHATDPDFGLRGTPEYMSPEALRGENLYQRADLYSVGVMLFEMLTGTRPYDVPPDTGQAEKVMLLRCALADGRLESALKERIQHLPDRCHAILAKATAVRPEDRYQSAGVFRDDLRRELKAAEARRRGEARTPIDPTASGVSSPSAAPGRRRWIVASVLAVALVVVGIGFGAYSLGIHPRDRNDGGTGPRNGQDDERTTKGPKAPPGVPGTNDRVNRTPDDAPPPAALPPLTADLTVWVRSKDAPRGTPLLDVRNPRLSLPTKAGDRFRIEATANRDAYFYLLQLDTEGNLWSLFPWSGLRFEAREPEQKRRRLEIPQRFGDISQEAPIKGGPAGLESILLLTRDEKLTLEEEATLRGLIQTLPKEATGEFRCVVWFRNGEIVRDTPDHKGADRGPILLKNSRPVEDLLPATLALLRGEEMRKLFPDTVGLSFPREEP